MSKLNKTIDVLTALVITLFLAICVSTAHCETGYRITGNIVNSRAQYAVISHGNPYVYFLGYRKDGSIIMDNEGRYFTRVNFTPYKASDEYTETILFCGNMSDNFNGTKGLIAIAYQKSSHRTLQGVGCHIAVSVIEVSFEGQ